MRGRPICLVAVAVFLSAGLLVGPRPAGMSEASAAGGCPIPTASDIIVPEGSYWLGSSGTYYECGSDGKWRMIGADKPVCDDAKFGRVIYDVDGRPLEFCNRSGQWELVDVSPRQQHAEGPSASAAWSVTVPNDPTRATTLVFDTGDGVITRSVPQGTGTTTFSLSHVYELQPEEWWAGVPPFEGSAVLEGAVTVGRATSFSVSIC